MEAARERGGERQRRWATNDGTLTGTSGMLKVGVGDARCNAVTGSARESSRCERQAGNSACRWGGGRERWSVLWQRKRQRKVTKLTRCKRATKGMRPEGKRQGVESKKGAFSASPTPSESVPCATIGQLL
jgi:hypothetical protein